MQKPPDIFQNNEKDLQQGGLISISSESLKIYLMIKDYISDPSLSKRGSCIGFAVCDWVQILDCGQQQEKTIICG